MEQIASQDVAVASARSALWEMRGRAAAGDVEPDTLLPALSISILAVLGEMRGDELFALLQGLAGDLAGQGLRRLADELLAAGAGGFERCGDRQRAADLAEFRIELRLPPLLLTKWTGNGSGPDGGRRCFRKGPTARTIRKR